MQVNIVKICLFITILQPDGVPPTMDVLPATAAAPIVSPAYVELQRDIVINADIWSTTAQILSADLGFEGIVGIPGLDGPGGLALAAAAGAGINRDWATLTPTPPLRNLTSGQPSSGLVMGGFGAAVVRGDALPIVFSWPVLPGTLAPTDIAIRLNTGEVVTPQAAALNPNFDYNERNIVVVFGEFGNRLTPGTAGAIYPVSVEIVADDKPLQLIGPNGLQSAVGLTANSRNPYVTGPSLLAARVSRFSSVGDAGPATLTAGILNDGATLYPGQATYRLRLMTTGGFSPDGVSPIMPGDFARFFQLQARDASGKLVTLDRAGVTYDLGAGLGKVTVVGLAELGPSATGIPAPYYRNDNDNYIDIILNGDETAIRSLINVSIPTSAVPGYSDIYTPGGPGRTPTPGVTYTRPASAQTLAISNGLDQLSTVSYAAQQLSAYDKADGLPVVFRLYHPGKADTVYTASSQQAAALLAAGYTEQGVPFSNEAAGPGKKPVIEFQSVAAGDHIYTLNNEEISRLRQDGSGYAETGAVFTGLTQPMSGASPVHRFHSVALGDHLYTPSLTEGFTAEGYAYEGIAWYAANLLPGDSGSLLFDRKDNLDFTGTLTGHNSLQKRGTGTLTLSADSSLTGTTRVEEGRLQVTAMLRTSMVSVSPGALLSGDGGIDGALLNAGTLSPGLSIGTLTVTGSVVSSGDRADLRVELGGIRAGAVPDGYDQLLVGGVFTAAGSLTPVTRGFMLADQSPFIPAVGQHFTIIQAAGGVAGSFQVLQQPVADLPTDARFDLVYGAQAVTLWVTPATYAALPGLSPAQNAVAAALDKTRPNAGTRDFTDRDAFYGGLYATRPAELAAALDQLAGSIHAEMAGAGLDTMRLFGDLLGDRMAATRRGSLSLQFSPATMQSVGEGQGRTAVAGAADAVPGLWGRAIVGSGARGAVDLDIAGFTTGIDARVADNIELGMSAGYVRSSVDGGAGHASQDVMLLAGYGGFTAGAFFGEASLALGLSDADSRRPIRLSGLDRRAEADGKGHMVGVGVSAGYRWAADNLLVEPAVSLRFDQAHRNGFVETGAGTPGLMVDGLDLRSWRSGIGLRAIWQAFTAGGISLEPEVTLRWDHDFRDVAASGRAWLDGGAFTLAGEAVGRDAAILGAGLAARLEPGLEGFMRVDLEERRGGDRQTLSGGIRWRFD